MSQGGGSMAPGCLSGGWGLGSSSLKGDVATERSLQRQGRVGG